jgi:hypothetical protein
MKRVAGIVALALLSSGCVRVGWITKDPSYRSTGLVDQDNRLVNVVGNPHVTCFRDGQVIADGYFVRYEDGVLTVDEFGKDYVYVSNPKCKLGGVQ